MNYLSVIKQLSALLFVTTIIAGSQIQAFAIDQDDNEAASANSNFANVDKSHEEIKHKLIEPGDVLEIKVFQEPDLTGQFKVDESGRIDFPLVGRFDVSGKDTEMIRTELTQALRVNIINPQVSIGFDFISEQYAKDAITVLGEVKNSGTYDMEPNISLTRVIALASGFTSKADVKNVKLIRRIDGEVNVGIFNIDEIHSGIIEDPEIMVDDKVVVPTEELDENGVAILGQVKRPGMFKVSEDMTLIRLIANAGGFSRLADASKVRVIREEDNQRKVILYDTRKILTGEKDDPKILPLDKVYVPESLF